MMTHRDWIANREYVRQIVRATVIVGASFLFVARFQAQATNDSASKESGVRRFEVGGQIADIDVGNCGILSHCQTPQLALGPGATLNVNRYIAIDATLNVLTTFDNAHYDSDRGVPAGGRAVEFLVGPRAEVRSRHYGLFAELAPGVLSWSQVTTAYSNGVNVYGRDNLFTLKLGGGAEYLPGSRVHVRFDVDDLLTKYNEPYSGFGHGNKPWLDSVQISTGVYFGIGKRIDGYAPERRAGAQHRFFDGDNLAVIGVSLLGQTADAITTQRFIAHGQPEQDPLARPLVKYGWGGQIGLAVITNSAEIAGMYWLHRMHHHRIERLLPLPYAVASGVMAYRNDQVGSPPTP